MQFLGILKLLASLADFIRWLAGAVSKAKVDNTYAKNNADIDAAFASGMPSPTGSGTVPTPSPAIPGGTVSGTGLGEGSTTDNQRATEGIK